MQNLKEQKMMLLHSQKETLLMYIQWSDFQNQNVY